MTMAQTEQNIEAPTSVIADFLRRSISISALMGRLWSGKFIIGLATFVGLAIGVWEAHSAGPQFIATISITPAESDLGSEGGGGGGSGILADLTGATNTAAVPKFTQFQVALSSVGAAKELETHYGMLCRIYRQDCDPVTHRWHHRDGLREWFAGVLAKIGGLPDPNGPRTIDDLADYVATNVTLETNKKNAIAILSFKDRNPQFSEEFLSAVVTSTNNYIKLLNRETQRKYVEYLTEASVKTMNVQQRQTIDTLLLQQDRQLMMTEVNAPYAATILDGPNAKPVNHVARIILMYGAFCGLIGCMFALSWPLLTKRNRGP